ncbi:emp24p/erv25p- protein [Microbotryomycetes sp. JL201]|nr:emp24p/erv25p- protein [Microbotryomycetes sp. JL201]
MGVVGTLASIGMAIGPPLAYIDQYASVIRRRSSAGFSTDTIGVLVTANLSRVVYWWAARFETALLVQSSLLNTVYYSNPPTVLMIAFQLALLRQCVKFGSAEAFSSTRPFRLWQWPDFGTYIEYCAAVIVGHLLFFVPLHGFPVYVTALGFFALGLEATLPVPQLLTNYERKSTAGFRLSVLASWVGGDAFKFVYFLIKDSPIAFRVCAAFQLGVDLAICAQTVLYRHNKSDTDTTQDGDAESASVPLSPSLGHVNAAELNSVFRSGPHPTITKFDTIAQNINRVASPAECKLEPMLRLAWVFALLSLCRVSSALYFYLGAGENRCFLEELPKDTIVVGHYKAEEWSESSKSFVINDHLGIQIVVTEVESGDKVVNTRGLPQGKFTFTSHEAGDHTICLKTNYTGGWFSTPQVRMHLDIAVGEAKVDEEGEREHVKDLASKVKDLNSRLADIRREQQFQREREADFRALSERTNSRAVWWSIAQLFTLIAACTWQLRHLRHFFESKKLYVSPAHGAG